VYVLKVNIGLRKKYYFGYTSDLRRRYAEHLKGLVKTTRNKNPNLIYYEAYIDKYIALKREKGIKQSGSVYTSLMKRLKEY